MLVMRNMSSPNPVFPKRAPAMAWGFSAGTMDWMNGGQAGLVTIVVCTYNRAARLKQAIASLQRLLIPPQWQLEILVVDNASHDETTQVVEAMMGSSPIPLRLAYEAEQGVSHARNRGLRSALGEWIAFFDDDQEADSNWIIELLRAANEHQTECVGGAVRLRLPEDFQGQLSGVCRILLSESPLNAPAEPYRAPRSPGTGNMLISRQLIQRVGLFDTAVVMGGEDTDLYHRIRETGVEPWFAPEAIIYHGVPKERLSRGYMLWNARRTGVHVADGEQRRFGKWLYPARFAARLMQAALKGPRIFKALRSHDVADGKRLGAECLLAAAGAYLRRMGQWYAPQILAQTEYFALLDFRTEREQFGS